MYGLIRWLSGVRRSHWRLASPTYPSAVLRAERVTKPVWAGFYHASTSASTKWLFPPDVAFCEYSQYGAHVLPAPRLLFAELKREGRKLRTEWMNWIHRLEKIPATPGNRPAGSIPPVPARGPSTVVSIARRLPWQGGIGFTSNRTSDRVEWRLIWAKHSRNPWRVSRRCERPN